MNDPLMESLNRAIAFDDFMARACSIALLVLLLVWLFISVLGVCGFWDRPRKPKVCAGATWWAPGHRFEARFDSEPRSRKPEHFQDLMIATTSETIAAIEASTAKTYRCDVCTRCGCVVSTPAQPEAK